MISFTCQIGTIAQYAINLQSFSAFLLSLCHMWVLHECCWVCTNSREEGILQWVFEACSMCKRKCGLEKLLGCFCTQIKKKKNKQKEDKLERYKTHLVLFTGCVNSTREAVRVLLHPKKKRQKKQKLISKKISKKRINWRGIKLIWYCSRAVWTVPMNSTHEEKTMVYSSKKDFDKG